MSELDPLDRLSRVANQPESPSREFRDRLLDELLDDLTADPSTLGATPFEHVTVDHTINEPTPEVMFLLPDRNEQPRGPRVWMVVAAAIAALALIGGLIVAGTRSDEDQVPTDEPEPTVPTVEPELEPEPAAVQEPLPFPGADVEPGRYETDLLGMPLTFDVAEAATVWTARPNRVLLADSSDLARPPYPATSRSLSFTRISGWNAREEAGDRGYFGPGSIDPEDIDGWAAVNDVTASIPPCCRTVTSGGEVAERVEVVVAGRDTYPLDVRLEPAETNQTSHCSDGESCLWVAAQSERGTGSRFDDGPLLSTGQVNRFWLLTIEGQDPLLIQAAAATNDEAWLELVENTTIATLELGPDAPPRSDG